MKFKIEPWAHQLEAIKRAQGKPGYALFFEMGTGKTATTINMLRERFNEQKRILRTLIFCPPIVINNWKDEWKLHSNLDPKQVTPLVGTGRERMALFQTHGFAQTTGKPTGCIFVTNYETLLMPELWAQMVHWAPEAIVFDESHKLKNHAAARSKRAFEIANHPNRPCFKYILSGSPVLNSPMDLFQQYKVMDGGQAFGGNFYAFRARYFYDKNAGMPKARYFPNWQIRPGALEDINRILAATGMRVEKKDCLDLPPLVRQLVKVGMTKEQERVYTELKKDYITFIGESACSAQLAIVKALRLMQVTSGFIALDMKAEEGDRAKIRFEETPKLEALEELLTELTPHSKVLVWAVWKENYAQISELCERLKIGFTQAHGGISADRQRQAVEDFNTREDLRVFIGHPGSLGIGVNLTCASYSIFYSRTFSLEHSLQAEARNHRGGSKEAGHAKITRIDLVCDNTIDVGVVERLHQKEQISFEVLKQTTL